MTIEVALISGECSPGNSYYAAVIGNEVFTSDLENTVLETEYTIKITSTSTSDEGEKNDVHLRDTVDQRLFSNKDELKKTQSANILVACISAAKDANTERQIIKLSSELNRANFNAKKQRLVVVITKADLLTEEQRVAAAQAIKKGLDEKKILYSSLEMTSAEKNCTYHMATGEKQEIKLQQHFTNLIKEYEQAEKAAAEKKQQDQETLGTWFAHYQMTKGNRSTRSKIFMRPNNPTAYRELEAVELLLQFRKIKRPGGASEKVLTAANSRTIAEQTGNHGESNSSSVQNLCLTYARNGGSFARAQEIFLNQDGNLKTEKEAIAALQAREARRFKMPFFSGASDKTLQKHGLSLKKK